MKNPREKTFEIRWKMEAAAYIMPGEISYKRKECFQGYALCWQVVGTQSGLEKIRET